MSNIILLKGADIFQKEHQVLSQVNLSLEAGEFVYLIGKTGSGKSSLLKTLFGILPLENGIGKVINFSLNELNRKNIPLLRRKVGFIFQDFMLLSDRTIEDNLLFAMEATGWEDKHLMRMKMDEVFIQVGLKNIEKKMPHQLSGGEQQRVVIARALINEPQLIIADEATGNLDPATSSEILQLLFNLSSKKQTSIIFATHDYRLIHEFPARIIKCEDGNLIEAEASLI